MRKNVLCLLFILIFFPTFLCAQETSDPKDTAIGKTGGVKSLEDRIQHLEEAIDRPVASDWRFLHFESALDPQYISIIFFVMPSFMAEKS